LIDQKARRFLAGFSCFSRPRSFGMRPGAAFFEPKNIVFRVHPRLTLTRVLRPFFPGIQIRYLLGRKLIDLYSHRFKLQPGDRPVDLFRHAVNFVR
jgi:hypothetical protein